MFSPSSVIGDENLSGGEQALGFFLAPGRAKEESAKREMDKVNDA